MSADHPAEDAKDAAEPHAFDGEPTRVLPPDEPPTPTWVPVIGVVVFLAALMMLFIGGNGDAEAPEPAAPKVQAAAQPAAAAPQAPVPQPGVQPVRPAPVPQPGVQPVRPAPGPPAGIQPDHPVPAASAAIPQLTPEQIQQLRKALEQRLKIPPAASAAPAAPAPPPAAPAPPPAAPAPPPAPPAPPH